MANVFDVAEYVLDKCGSTTTMKLQKLVYYCQAWSLAWDEVPLFDNDFEAWANGPVCKTLFDAHKGYFNISKGFFNSRLSDDPGFSKDSIKTMDAVISGYSSETPLALSELSHSESPWKDARRGYAPGQPCSNVIAKESMQEYYAGLL